jgi:hypothetical protein
MSCLLLGSFWAFPALALSCHPAGAPLIQLQVVPGEIASPGRELIISLYSNDCVHLKLPDFYRRSGEHVVLLNGTERVQIDTLQRELQQAPYEHRRMLEEAKLIDARADGETRRRFVVLDADYYALTQHDGARTTTITALAVPQYAEHYPEIRSLGALQRLVAALVDLSRRDDLVAVAATNVEAGQ